jgi:hypothetical protein
LAPYSIEAKVYASQIKEQFPDGAKVALFTVNNEFGQVYLDAFKEIANAADSGIEIVDEQTIEADSSSPPTAQINAIASKAPDAIVAVPLGAQCPTFLTEVANAKAANAGWTPNIFLTNTCASSLILAGAGEAADGLFTSNNLVDVNDPANAAKPAVADYIAYMTAEGNKTSPYSGRGVKVKPYDIPLRALIARDVDGLMMAGRCISGDFIAHASYRVTGNSVAMGEAVGATAAVAAKHKTAPHSVPWSEVQPVIEQVRSKA